MVEVITWQFPLRLADRSPQILGGGVRLADHLAAFTGRGFQSAGEAHRGKDADASC
jgi:hypothetical protein